jgi:hypothetical protein
MPCSYSFLAAWLWKKLDVEKLGFPRGLNGFKSFSLRPNPSPPLPLRRSLRHPAKAFTPFHARQLTLYPLPPLPDNGVLDKLKGSES